jgi:ATP-dependent Clp protease protease subunit
MASENEEVATGSGHTSSLNDSGIYVFMDEVTDETIKPVIEWILYENFVQPVKKKELLLMVCSAGGELQSAFALIDVMASSLIPIKTVGLGQISSSGLLIFMSGTQGRRILTPNTSILSHQFSWFSEGKSHELFATMKEFSLTQQRMVDLYRRCTGADDETIKTKMLPAQDIWLSADEALELKICDAIGSNQPQAQPQPVPTTTPTKKVKTK